MKTTLAARLPGIALAAVIAMAAAFVSSLHGGPLLLYALLFGVCFNHLSHEPRTRPGIEFCSRTLLRLAVGLLGARITAGQIAALGWTTAAVTVAGVASTIAVGVLLARRFGLGTAQGVLSGGAVAICGASAALAIAAVLPREKDGARQTLMVVITVTVLSTVAMVAYPLLAKALALPPELAGLFIGGTIHDVAQVVGAGYMLGTTTGDTATIVKLFRVSLLAIVVFAVALAFRRERDGRGSAAPGAPAPARQPMLPWFLWLFIALTAVNSAGLLAPAVQAALSDFSRGCLVTAIAALGTMTSVAQLGRSGWRPLALIVAETVWLAAVVLGAALALR